MKLGADGAYSLAFDATALKFGLLANCFAAFKGAESKKLMTDTDIKARYGGVGNQYAVTEIIAFQLRVFVPHGEGVDTAAILGRIVGERSPTAADRAA